MSPSSDPRNADVDKETLRDALAEAFTQGYLAGWGAGFEAARPERRVPSHKSAREEFEFAPIASESVLSEIARDITWEPAGDPRIGRE